MQLDNKTVLVTGGTRGIGAAMVDQLLNKGCTVLVTARPSRQLDDLARRAWVECLPVDFAEPDAGKQVAAWVAETAPDCAVVINNAAIMSHGFLSREPESKLAEMAREVQINLTAPSQIAVAMLPILRQQPQAAIVNVTSGLALAPIPNAAVYCATKAALGMFTKGLRQQIEAEGLPIQMTEAMMTLVDTDLSEGDPDKKYPPDSAAWEVLRGIERGDRVTHIQRVKLLHRLWRVSPALAERIMARHEGAR